MPRRTWKLPETINPDRICVQLRIPDDIWHKNAFFGSLENLTKAWNWDYTEDKQGSQVAYVWSDILHDMIIGDLACNNGGDCRTHVLSEDWVQFSPMNPFINPNEIPNDYLVPPFQINGDADEPYITLPNAAIVVPYVAVNLSPDWLTGFGTILPQIKLETDGTGQITINYFGIPFGGVFIVTQNRQPNFTDLVSGVVGSDAVVIETQQDVSSLPPESPTMTSVSIDVDTPETDIFITFLPVINDQLPPILFGGALSYFEMCGTLRPRGTELDDPIENTGGIIVTTKEEICEAIICAMEEHASRFLSGQAGNLIGGIDIDTDGNVTIDDSENSEIIISDAGTNALRFGQMQAVADGIQKIISDIDAFFATGKIDTVTQYYIENLYDIDDTAELLIAIGIYFSYITNNPLQAGYQYDADTLAKMFYCEGIIAGTVSRFALFELVETELDDFFISLFRAISQTQINTWLENGENTPNYGFVSSACYRMPIASYDVDLNSFTWFDDRHNFIWPEYPDRDQHNMIIKVEGFLINEDNNKSWNGLFTVDNNTGVVTQNVVKGLVNGTNTNQGAEDENAVYEDGKNSYQFNITMQENKYLSGIETVGKPDWSAKTVTGSLKFTRIDLGVI